jgi:hypothetical protein
VILIALAIFVGFVGAAAIAVWNVGRIVRALIAPKRARRLAYLFAIMGGTAAIYPALFLALAVGGNLGGAYGESLSPHGTSAAIAIAIGLSIGIAVMLGLIVSIGATIGTLVAKLILWISRRGEPG